MSCRPWGVERHIRLTQTFACGCLDMRCLGVPFFQLRPDRRTILRGVSRHGRRAAKHSPPPARRSGLRQRAVRSVSGWGRYPFRNERRHVRTDCATRQNSRAAGYDPAPGCSGAIQGWFRDDTVWGITPCDRRLRRAPSWPVARWTVAPRPASKARSASLAQAWSCLPVRERTGAPCPRHARRPPGPAPPPATGSRRPAPS